MSFQDFAGPKSGRPGSRPSTAASRLSSSTGGVGGNQQQDALRPISESLLQYQVSLFCAMDMQK